MNILDRPIWFRFAALGFILSLIWPAAIIMTLYIILFSFCIKAETKDVVAT